VRRLLSDLHEGLRRWRVWHELAWIDIRQRYRRSVIGPFWITISLAIFVAVLGVLYSVLFKMELKVYVPFLAAGYVVWNFVYTLVMESCQVFVESEHIIKQIRVPLTVFVLRTLWRNVIILAHSLPIIVVVLAVFGSPLGLPILLVVPGFLLLAMNGVWLGLLLGILCARFRDIPAIVQNLMQVVFFVTPIFWPPELLSSHPYLVEWNVVYHMVELMRAPLLNQYPSAVTWLSVLAVTLAGYLMAATLFRKHGPRVAHWV
jgi:homopolymeric O-antigen transport system permease protein